MKFERAAINRREEISAQPGDQDCQRTKGASEEYSQERSSMVERSLEQTAIAVAEFFEGLLKTPLKSHEWIAAVGTFFLRFIPA